MNRTYVFAAFSLASHFSLRSPRVRDRRRRDGIPDGTYTVKVVKVVDAKHVRW